MKSFLKAKLILIPILVALVFSVGILIAWQVGGKLGKREKEIEAQFEVTLNEDGLTLEKINYLEGDVLNIPESIDGHAVTALDFSCKEGVNFSVLNVPSSVKRIGASKDWTPDGAVSLNFTEASRLEYIEAYAFMQWNIEEIVIPKTVKEIGVGAFRSCSLKKVVFEEDGVLRTIKEDVFAENHGLKEVVLSDSLEKIETNAFANCGIELLQFSQSGRLKLVENSAFFGNPLELVFLPNSVAYIGDNAFTANGTDRYTTRVVFEQGGSQALIETFETEPFVLYTDVTGMTESEGVYYVNADGGYTAIYAEAKNEVKIGASIEGIKVTTVGSQLLSARTTEKTDSVRIGKGVTRIEETAFSFFGSSLAKNVYLPKGVTYVGANIGGDYLRLGDSERTAGYENGWADVSVGVAFGYDGYKTSSDGIEYTTDEQGAVILRVKENATANEYGVIELPSSLDGKNVYKIADHACVGRLTVFAQRNIREVTEKGVDEQCVMLYEGEALSATARSIGNCESFGRTDEYVYVTGIDGGVTVLSYTGVESGILLDKIAVDVNFYEVVGFVDYAFEAYVENVFYSQGIVLYGKNDGRYHEYLS